jgi:hypothetical protein
VAKDSVQFQKFCSDARAMRFRPEITVTEVPAPAKLAPFSIAFSADLVVGGDDVATGRFVMLHDPNEQEAWSGTFRCVTFVRSAIESEMQSDPILADVAWTWFLDALKESGAESRATSGTVTRVSSSSFGQMSETEHSAEIEIRASWTPVAANHLERHFSAWSRLLEVAAGLTPLTDGVSSIGPRN